MAASTSSPAPRIPRSRLRPLSKEVPQRILFPDAFGGVGFARLLFLGNDLYNLRLNGKRVAAGWHDIIVADSPPPFTKDVAPMISSTPNAITPAPPFRLPQWLIRPLMLLGVDAVVPLLMVSKPVGGVPLHMPAVFLDMNASECIHLVLGTTWTTRTRRVADRYGGDSEPHNCQEHHIDAWPGWAKDFGDKERTIRLSFSRCRLTPDHTLVVHIELEGQVTR